MGNLNDIIKILIEVGETVNLMSDISVLSQTTFGEDGCVLDAWQSFLNTKDASG